MVIHSLCIAGYAAANRAQASGLAPSFASASVQGPLFDHHQHLLSDAGAASLQLVEGGSPVAADLPSHFADLLQRRTTLWKDRSALAEVYTADVTQGGPK
jgi:hypothetical protein